MDNDIYKNRSDIKVLNAKLTVEADLYEHVAEQYDKNLSAMIAEKMHDLLFTHKKYMLSFHKYLKEKPEYRAVEITHEVEVRALGTCGICRYYDSTEFKCKLLQVGIGKDGFCSFFIQEPFFPVDFFKEVV